ncbi:MAG: hypothetical protein NW217_03130 [Hyphomicrobiaceae bacterium]|nr:hypothetical protein [Hyphomicrobiaceae bacterium]
MARRPALGVLLIALLTASSAMAQGTCARSDFEAVVDDAAASLRDLNQKNRPSFQEKLRDLKDKRGWSHDAFIEAAAPFVKDDTIVVYDQKAQDLLSEIATLGEEGSQSGTPDCGLLTELRARMQSLVSIQTEKWAYMFGKLDKALAE